MLREWTDWEERAKYIRRRREEEKRERERYHEYLRYQEMEEKYNQETDKERRKNLAEEVL